MSDIPFYQKEEAANKKTSSKRLEILAGIDVELARLVARNSNASPQLLKALAFSQDFATRAGVATNPNTSPDILWKLAEEFPREFLENPVLSLLRLKNPNCILEQSLNILSALVKEPTVPEWLLDGAIQYYNSKKYSEVLLAIAANPKITDESLYKIINTEDKWLLFYLIKKSNLTSNIIKKLSQNKITNYCDFREAIAKHRNTPLEVLEKLAFDPELKVKKAVALRSDLTIELIAKMAADRQIMAKKFLLRNKSFSESLLSTLAQSSEQKVLQMVALHPNTSISLLEKLATVPSAKSSVAQNSNVTREILEHLAESDDKEVQLAVVKNPLSTSKILSKISLNTSNSQVLISIVENQNTSESIKIKILERLSDSYSFSVRKYVAQNPHTPKSILTFWSQSKALINLYPWLARNPNTPIVFLDIFSKNFCSKNVAIGLAKNPNTPKEILKDLTNKYRSKYDYGCFYDDVRFALAMNINSPDETRNGSYVKFFRRKITSYCVNNFDVYSDFLWLKIKYGDKYDFFLLSQDNLPLVALEKILARKSNSWFVRDRKFVARHPKTPTHILEKLTQDQDIGVRDAAKYRLDQRNP